MALLPLTLHVPLPPLLMLPNPPDGSSSLELGLQDFEPQP